MKKIMTMLATLLFCVAALAQTAPETLTTWSSHIEKTDVENVYKRLHENRALPIEQ